MPGNPNPDTSGLIPWKKGQSGNPSGKPREVFEAEQRAAQAASLLRDRMAAAFLRRVESLEDRRAKIIIDAQGPLTESEQEEVDEIDLKIMAMVSTDSRGLITEASDRAYGKPRSADGGDDREPQSLEINIGTEAPRSSVRVTRGADKT